MFYQVLKRTFDFSLALAGLFFFLPVIMLIICIILLEDGFPIFYLKQSLGKNALPFGALKFRSMHRGSLSVTRCGYLLRQTAMDELPQLLNILKGQMSFVGPRNYSLEKYALEKDSAFLRRLEITPGLTGLAQVRAPKYAPNQEVLKWDLGYLSKRGFWLDVRIILLSIWITLMRRWEKTTRRIHD